MISLTPSAPNRSTAARFRTASPPCTPTARWSMLVSGTTPPVGNSGSGVAIVPAMAIAPIFAAAVNPAMAAQLGGTGGPRVATDLTSPRAALAMAPVTATAFWALANFIACSRPAFVSVSMFAILASSKMPLRSMRASWLAWANASFPCWLAWNSCRSSASFWAFSRSRLSSRAFSSRSTRSPSSMAASATFLSNSMRLFALASSMARMADADADACTEDSPYLAMMASMAAICSSYPAMSWSRSAMASTSAARCASMAVVRSRCASAASRAPSVTSAVASFVSESASALFWRAVVYALMARRPWAYSSFRPARFSSRPGWMDLASVSWA
uniref:Uncharacterized protein n=1 Tax=uncultured marine virus TaxID=186617 RepID=A0A0F7L5D3_9VIRU|nr:hypothetical protein [uncultured marine virus]